MTGRKAQFLKTTVELRLKQRGEGLSIGDRRELGREVRAPVSEFSGQADI